MSERVIERTSSICPRCGVPLEAVIVEREGAAIMRKRCGEHGDFEALIAKHAWYYEGLNKFYDAVSARTRCFGAPEMSDYQLFPRINSGLESDIFFSDSSDAPIDIPLSEIEALVKSIPGSRKIVMIGGEPTLRSDLPSIIRIISGCGHRPWLYSGGCRLDDTAYVKELRCAGLMFVWLWVDSFRSGEVYAKIRGTGSWTEKRRVVDAVRTARVPLGIITPIVRGVNEGEIGQCVDFCRARRFVSAAVIKSYSHVGRKKFSPQSEFSVDELVEIIAAETGLITLEEFYVFQKLLYALFSFNGKPSCHLKQFAYVPRRGERPLRDIADLRQFESRLDEYAGIYADDPGRARGFLMKELIKFCASHPLFAVMLGSPMSSWCQARFLRVDVSAYYTGLSYDSGKVRRRCHDVWLNGSARSEPVDFCRALIHSFKVDR